MRTFVTDGQTSKEGDDPHYDMTKMYMTAIWQYERKKPKPKGRWVNRLVEGGRKE